MASVKKVAVKKAAVKKAAVKKPAVKKPAVKKTVSKPSVIASSVTKELKSAVAALKQDIRDLKAEMKNDKKKKVEKGKHASKRENAVHKFLEDWDKKAHSAMNKLKSKKKAKARKK